MRALAPSLFLLATSLTAADPVAVASPDGRLDITLREDAAGAMTFAVTADGQPRLVPSPVGFAGGAWKSTTRRSQDTVWKPVWGKRATVPDRCNEATLDLTTYRLVVRAYDDGVAFRYDGLPAKAAEATRFQFANDATAWSYNGERHNLGPELLSTITGKRLPVMTLKADDHAYLALHEANLPTGEPLWFNAVPGTTTLAVGSRPSEAWRVVLYGRSPGDLVDSHLIELLSPPPAEGTDFSWVKPGVCVWDWRINGAEVPGFQYAMSLPSWKRMVDFAAEHGAPHLVLDADWYGPEHQKDSHPTAGGKVEQVREIIAYGKTKGVGVWLYLNDVAGRNFPLEDTLRQYAEWGASGVKYGFMQGGMEEKNQRTRLITELCAQHHLLIDFHDGPVHPYGQMRTFPNAVTREFCQAQLDAKKVFEPKTFVTSVFVNMIAGPLDMNNGIADLAQKGRKDNGKPVPSTVVGEMARTLIVFSGATVIPDIPEYYRTQPDLLRFLGAQRQPWRESRTVSGVIGEHIVMARQAADGAWLVGAATDESARTLDVPLTFLGADRYEALIIEDGPEADYRHPVASSRSRTQTVTAADHLNLDLAPGGGACVLLRLAR